MNVKMLKEQDVIREALEILERHMEPAKVALLISMLPVGEGNYLAIREKLFANETVATLVEKIQVRQDGEDSISLP